MNIDKQFIMSFKKYIIRKKRKPKKYEDFSEPIEYYVHENRLDARNCTLDELKKLVRNIQGKRVKCIFECLKGCPADIVREIIKHNELQYEKIDRLTINASAFEDTKFIKKLLKYCNINRVHVKDTYEHNQPIMPLVAYLIEYDNIEMMKYIIKLGVNLKRSRCYIDRLGRCIKAKPISLAFIRSNEMANIIRKSISIH